MTDLLLKSSGPVADQYRVLAGDVVVGHIRLSEIGATNYTLALDFVSWAAQGPSHTDARLRGNSRGGVAGVRQELAEGMNDDQSTTSGSSWIRPKVLKLHHSTHLIGNNFDFRGVEDDSMNSLKLGRHH